MLTLIKTTGGSNGVPKNCKCGSVHFVRAGFGWSCGSCGLYLPGELKGNSVVGQVIENLRHLQDLHAQLKSEIGELEAIVAKKD